MGAQANSTPLCWSPTNDAARPCRFVAAITHAIDYADRPVSSFRRTALKRAMRNAADRWTAAATRAPAPSPTFSSNATFDPGGSRWVPWQPFAVLPPPRRPGFPTNETGLRGLVLIAGSLRVSQTDFVRLESRLRLANDSAIQRELLPSPRLRPVEKKSPHGGHLQVLRQNVSGHALLLS
jgi:hypothetical protein